jgi:dUTP pyrophosphatase
MQIKALHKAFIMPTKGTEQSGAYDIFMPEAGIASNQAQLIGLGFAAEVPLGCVAMLLPRSSYGTKYGIEVTNTCGIIDSDYRGEWKVAIRTKFMTSMPWKAGDRLFQFLIVPVISPVLSLVTELGVTDRGTGGFGSSGN